MPPASRDEMVECLADLGQMMPGLELIILFGSSARGRAALGASPTRAGSAARSSFGATAG